MAPEGGVPIAISQNVLPEVLGAGSWCVRCGGKVVADSVSMKELHAWQGHRAAPRDPQKMTGWRPCGDLT